MLEYSNVVLRRGLMQPEILQTDDVQRAFSHREPRVKAWAGRCEACPLRTLLC